MLKHGYHVEVYGCYSIYKLHEAVILTYKLDQRLSWNHLEAYAQGKGALEEATGRSWQEWQRKNKQHWRVTEDVKWGDRNEVVQSRINSQGDLLSRQVWQRKTKEQFCL